MKRRRMLDLCCKAGGCSKGYNLAGFEMVGVDIEPQKRYPFEFIQADILEVLKMERFIASFDAIHASPPCQEFSSLRHLPGYKKGSHADLIQPVRDLITASGKPFIIENVPGAPLRDPLMLCGSMFGLRTDCGAELRRHRLFEVPWFWEWWYQTQDWFGGLPQCAHFANSTIGVYAGKAWDRSGQEKGALPGQKRRDRTIGVSGTVNPMTGARQKNRVISVNGDHPRDASIERNNRTVTGDGHSIQTNVKTKGRTVSVTGSTPQQNVVRNKIRETFPVEQARIAMGIDWMTMAELSQAIPPAYTRFIGCLLMDYLESIE